MRALRPSRTPRRARIERRGRARCRVSRPSSIEDAGRRRARARANSPGSSPPGVRRRAPTRSRPRLASWTLVPRRGNESFSTCPTSGRPDHENAGAEPWPREPAMGLRGRARTGAALDWRNWSSQTRFSTRRRRRERVGTRSRQIAVMGNEVLREAAFLPDDAVRGHPPRRRADPACSSAEIELDSPSPRRHRGRNRRREPRRWTRRSRSPFSTNS
jgi:hypothetical protein